MFALPFHFILLWKTGYHQLISTLDHVAKKLGDQDNRRTLLRLCKQFQLVSKFTSSSTFVWTKTLQQLRSDDTLYDQAWGTIIFYAVNNMFDNLSVNLPLSDLPPFRDSESRVSKWHHSLTCEHWNCFLFFSVIFVLNVFKYLSSQCKGQVRVLMAVWSSLSSLWLGISIHVSLFAHFFLMYKIFKSMP